MTLDLGRIISHTFSIAWRHNWLWLLGVFGGGAGVSFGGPRFGTNFGVNFGPGVHTTSPSAEQISAFIRDNLGLIITGGVALLVFILVLVVISWIAVPASVWAAVRLDAGEPVRLGEAWSQGLRRFWAVLRLFVLRFLIGLALAVIGFFLFLIGVAIHAAAGPASLVALIPLGFLLYLALLVAYLIVALALAWSERMLVLLGLGAIESFQASWWIFWRHKLDTFVFALVMGIVALAVGIGVVIGAGILAIPGIILLVAGVVGSQTGFAVFGVVLIVLLAGAFLLVGGGYGGSLVQVSYALAARDLLFRHGMELALEAAPTGTFEPPPEGAQPILPPGAIPPPPSSLPPPLPPPPPSSS